MPTHFSTKEMQARRKAVVTRLDELGLDGLLMFKQESMYYLTGYDSFGFSLFFLWFSLLFRSQFSHRFFR